MVHHLNLIVHMLHNQKDTWFKPILTTEYWSKIDEAVKIVEAGEATTIKELTKSEKDKLKALATEVSEKTEVKVTIAKGGVVTVYNTDGTVFTKVSDPIQYTNDNTALIVALGALAVLGGAILVKKNVLS